MRQINVKIPANQAGKEYNVDIQKGILDHVGELIGNIWNKRKIALISDDNVAPIYQGRVADSLEKVGFEVKEYQFPAGEESKSLDMLGKLISQMAADHFTRDDAIVALGGGVTGDLAGFVAATYMRGISLVQIPTSLLAQVDSSVGGKTAVDHNDTKNIIGAFLQPDLVIIDPETLRTLHKRDLVEGYGEIVKTAGLTDGPLWDLVNKINSVDDILENAEELSELSIQYKTTVVEQDAQEGGIRQLLNFGHTIGHAVEALSEGDLRHGEAVSIGLVAICRIFESKGLSPKGLTQEIKDRFDAVGLPTTSRFLDDPAAILDKIKNDKKNHNGHLNLVYLKAIGGPAIKSVPSDEIADFLNLTDLVK